MKLLYIYELFLRVCITHLPTEHVWIKKNPYGHCMFSSSTQKVDAMSLQVNQIRQDLIT